MLDPGLKASSRAEAQKGFKTPLFGYKTPSKGGSIDPPFLSPKTAQNEASKHLAPRSSILARNGHFELFQASLKASEGELRRLRYAAWLSRVEVIEGWLEALKSFARL